MEGLRPRDQEELASGWNQTAWETLSLGLAESSRALTVLYGTRVMCAVGVMPMEMLTGRYALWIVGTREIDQHPLAFARATRKWLPYLIEGCAIVTNRVDRTDERALKWATWLGCEFRPYKRGDTVDERFWQFFLEGKGGACQQVA